MGNKINRHDPATAIPLLEKKIEDLTKGQNEIEIEIENLPTLDTILYRVDIFADNGSNLSSEVLTTTLTAQLTVWDKDITADTDASFFAWTRVSGNDEQDALWNAAYGKNKKSIVLDGGDVGTQSTFICTVNDKKNLYTQSQIIVSSIFRLEAIESDAIVSSKEQFYQSTSPTELSGGSWSDKQPVWTDGKYIWKRTLVTYGDGRTEYTPSENGVCITGNTGLQGLQGPQGEQGIPGNNSYFHIKYSPVENPTESQMTETPDIYIGTYVDDVSKDSTDPNKYKWARFQGLQGEKGDQGIPGVGTDGKTSYLHIKYSNVANPTKPEEINDVGGDYIGQYTDFIQADSTDPSKYTWTKIKGEKGDTGDTGPQGPGGDDGQMLYAISGTGTNTAAKVATLSSGTLTLKAGVSVAVKFTNANTAVNPTLNVNNTGAKSIYTNGLPFAYWSAGQTVVFSYDGTNWQVASTPVYANTVTVGNSAGKHVHINDEGVNIRDNGIVLASFERNTIHLGKENAEALISMCNGTGRLYASNVSGSDFFNLSSDNTRVFGKNNVRLESSPYNEYQEEYGSGAISKVDVSSQGTSSGKASLGVNIAYLSNPMGAHITASADSTSNPHVSMSVHEGDVRNEITLDPDGLKYNGEDVSLVKFDKGYVTTSNISAGSYQDVAVTFTKQFSNVPRINLTLASSSTAGAIGSISATILANSETTTGFTIRVFNAGTATRSPGIYWTAIEEIT